VNAANGQSSRLIGWKAIGHFLRCTERTARRWEADRALPVHRVPGGGRSSVWALTEELSAWLSTLPSEAREEAGKEADFVVPAPLSDDVSSVEPTPPAAAAARVDGLLRAAIVGLVGILVLSGVMIWKSAVHRPLATASCAYRNNSEARDIFATARFELSIRTADSLAAAERDFRRVIQMDPGEAAGWSGLADTYLLLREFGSIGDEVAYPKASEAAQKAITLDPSLADAWLDQAFVAFWWQGDADAAFHDFNMAIQLDPKSAKAFHWYGSALVATGQFDRCLQMMARARALDPNSRAIVADEGWLQFIAGRRTEGLATLERMVKIDPSFVSWHSYLSRAYLVLARDEDFLREALTTAELRGAAEDMVRLRLAQAQFLAGGRQAMLRQLGSSEEQALASGAGSAVLVALYRALAHDEDDMFHWLAVAEANHDHNLPRLRADPEFADYRDQPRFQAILQ
jgi:Tfp pilus assembly protein PilF